MAFNPYFFCDSPLPMELIQKALMELGELKPTVDELKAKVDKLVADLDGAIKDEVQKVIDDMYENGELADIIADIISEHVNSALAPRNFTVETARNWRIALPSNTYNSTDFDEELYSFCQGGCVTKNWYNPTNPNSRYFIGAFVCSNSSNHKYNDNVDLRVYEWNTHYNTFAFIKHKIVSAQHGNSIAVDIDNGYIYVAPSIKYNGGTTQVDSNLLFKYDFDLNEIGVTKINALSKCSNVAVYNGDVYVCQDGNTLNIKKILEWGSAVNGAVVMDFANIETPAPHNSTASYSLSGCGISITDDFIFIGRTGPNAVYRYNRHSNQIDNMYNIGDFGNGHMYPLGEVENISVVDDIIYIGTCQQSNNLLSYWDYTQMFSFNYINNSECANELYQSRGNAYRVIHVGDSTSADSVRSAYREFSNPNGLSDNPFALLSEALMYANAQNLYTNIRIKCITRNLIEYLVIDTNKNIVIDGEDYYAAHKSLETVNNRWVHIGGLHIDHSNVSLSIVQIENRTPTTLNDQFSRYQIYAINSTLNINSDTKFHVTGREDNSRLIYANRVFANIGTMLNNSGNAITFTHGPLTSNDYNTFIYNSSINFHGHFDGSSNSVLATV